MAVAVAVVIGNEELAQGPGLCLMVVPVLVVAVPVAQSVRAQLGHYAHASAAQAHVKHPSDVRVVYYYE